MVAIRGGSSTDESLFDEGGRIPERTRSTSHLRERKHTYIYKRTQRRRNTKDRDRRCDIIRDYITRTKTRYINKTRERNRGFHTANSCIEISLNILINIDRSVEQK
jgi:hypothetical protein